MKAIATAARELWGMFVDDGKLALGLVVWCALAGLVFRRLPISPEAGAVLLAFGCIAILAVTVFAAARQRRLG